MRTDFSVTPHLRGRDWPRQATLLFWVVLASSGCAAILALLGAAIHQWPGLVFAADYLAYHSGGAILAAGEGGLLYDLSAQNTVQMSLQQQYALVEGLATTTEFSPFLSPPAMAIPFAPISLLGPFTGYLVWLIFSLSLTVIALALCTGWVFRPVSRVLLLSSFAGVAVTLVEGQVNSVMVISLALFLTSLSASRQVAGGAALGLLWLKPQYAIPFALALTARHRWSELLGMIGSGLVLGIGSVAIVGIPGTDAYLSLMREVSAYYPPEGYQINPILMVNWRAVLMFFWPGISEQAGSALVYLISAATVLLALLSLKGKWQPSSARFAFQMLAVTAASLISSPHSHFHATILLLAPTAVGLARLSDEEDGAGVLKALLVGGYLLGIVVLPLRGLSWLVVPYLLLVVLVVASLCRRDPTWGTRVLSTKRIAPR